MAKRKTPAKPAAEKSKPAKRPQEAEPLKAEAAKVEAEARPETPAEAPVVADAAAETEALRAEVEGLREERERHLRQLAEAENRQRRLDKERDRERRFLAAEMLVELLPLDEALQRAAEALQREKAGLGDGVELIARNLHEIFERFKVRRLEPKGEPFDPNLHEAVSIQDSAEAKPDTVLEVMQAGYALEDRVLRPARVVVARAPAAEAADDKTDDKADDKAATSDS